MAQRSANTLRVAFRVEMSRESVPNKARIVVWNLAPDSIATLQRPGAVVQLLVGYDIPRLIFQGNPVKNGVRLERQGPDRTLTIEAQDGGAAYQSARVNLTFAPQTTSAQVFAALVAALGLPTGVVVVPPVVFPSGLTIAGTARDALDTLARATASHWYVRDGVLFYLPADAATPEAAVAFSAAAGTLIGSPTPSDKGLEVKGLLDPAVRPGRPFVVESAQFRGLYIARDVVFEGDSGYDLPFYVTATGRPPPGTPPAVAAAVPPLPVQTYPVAAWYALPGPARAALSAQFRIVLV
jgi:hypothetical protein